MRSRTILLFALAAAALAAPATVHPVSADSTALPYVDSITTLPATPCEGMPTRIVVAGAFTDGCGRVLGSDPSRLLIAVSPNPDCSRACPTVMTPWADTLDLGRLAAGSHRAVITLAVVNRCVAPPETSFYKADFGFTVGLTCALDPLRFLKQVRIVPARDTLSPIVCDGDSIAVLLSGEFPDNCLRLRRVDLLPSPIASPLPQPPIVRLLFDNLCCAGMVCGLIPRPWTAAVTLPPLPGGLGYNLILEGVEVCCRDNVLPEDPRGVRSIRFAVVGAESCGIVPPPPYACLMTGWDHRDRVGVCDTFFEADGKAGLTYMVRPMVPLSGLQGAVSVTDGLGAPGLLAVDAIEPIGPAAGMHLTWQPEPSGATFVLFAEKGAPIPAPSPTDPPVPILRFTFRHLETAGIYGFAEDPVRRWFVLDRDVMGSDVAAHAVPPCPVRAERMMAEVGTICVGAGMCDANADGRTDVRDLVLAVHCLLGVGPCPPDTLARLDCEGDGDFDLADVICCAHAVLGRPRCPDCAPDSTRPEPAIALSFGEPVRVASGVDIPARLEGADRLGAARFAFAMPADWVAGATLRLAHEDAGWLAFDQRQEGRLAFGLVSLPILTLLPRPGRLDLVLHLELPAGGEGAGVVSLAENELSGGDGVMLASDLGAPAVRLGPGVGLAVSAARPNPFRASTALRLTLDAAADVDFGIYDLAGRRVASLHRGRLGVGSHPFTWSGRDDGGAQVPGGVYFARASVAGRSTVQKLVMVRGD